MKKHEKANLILLLAAAIWGLAFVAQRVGLNYIGSFTFNGVRFAIGSISLIPLILFFNKADNNSNLKKDSSNAFVPGIICGIILFIASSFQQVGLVGTTAGKAAFITALYIIIVPIFGVFLKQRIGFNTWIGALIAIIGLYLLCVTGKFYISRYDLLELMCALFFALHIIVINRFSNKVDVLKLAFTQFLTASIISMIMALVFEKIALSSLIQAAIPLLYGGILSTGVAYTLQIVGQKDAEPTQAAIVMSMESVFATLGGFLILNEKLGVKGLWGCALIFAGMILSQIKFKNVAQNK